MQSRQDQLKVAVITGASAGIGRATAREFAGRGCAVALLARGTEGLAAAAREVEALGGRALVVPTDVARHEQVERAAARVVEAFGRIDIRVNSCSSTTAMRPGFRPRSGYSAPAS